MKQQPKTETALYSLRESFPYEFPQIINTPITKTEVTCTTSSLKNKISCDYDSLYNKVLKVHGNQIYKNHVVVKFLNLSHKFTINH
jgi:hypothetical protein